MLDADADIEVAAAMLTGNFYAERSLAVRHRPDGPKARPRSCGERWVVYLATRSPAEGCEARGRAFRVSATAEVADTSGVLRLRCAQV